MEHDIKKIFRLLSDEGFKDPGTGLLFFPAYIYTYPPQDEYLIRKQIEQLNNDLKRPSNNLNCLVVNIYEEFLDYLKQEKLSGETIFNGIVELEKSDYKYAKEYLTEIAESTEFLHSIGDKVKSYFSEKSSDKVYLIIHGFGSIFPYLRASHFLKNTEEYIKHFKVIIFYPGTFKSDNYSLFDICNDDNLYRANHLNQMLH